MIRRAANSSMHPVTRLGTAVVLAGAMVGLLSGCGSSETKQQECASLIGDEHAACIAELRQEEGKEVPRDGMPPDESSTTEEAETARFDETAVLYLSNEEGYTSKAELQRGLIRPAGPESINGSLSAGSACELDYEKDAVEPIQLRVYNTTDQFSASVGMAVRAATPHGELPGLHAEIGYSEGPECLELSGYTSQYSAAEGGGELIAFASTEPLEPGDFISAQGFLILDDYYSPAHPQGNPAHYTNTILVLEPQYGGENFTVARAEGVLEPKGDEAVQNSAVHNAIPVIPGTEGGCLVQPPCEAAFETE